MGSSQSDAMDDPKRSLSLCASVRVFIEESRGGYCEACNTMPQPCACSVLCSWHCDSVSFRACNVGSRFFWSTRTMYAVVENVCNAVLQSTPYFCCYIAQ